MPTYEHHVLQQHKDQNGNMHIDYPITKSECVDGLYEDAVLTGVPTAPTAAAGTSTTQVATTEFVQAAVASAAGSGTSLDDLGYTMTTDPSTGAITKVYTNGTTVVTQKNSDGSVAETTYVDGTATKTETTVKNADGSITVTVESASGDVSYTITKDPQTGTVTCTYSDGTKIVTQTNDDGSITETTYVNDKVTKTVTTVKNSDGSITVTPITS